MVVGAALILTSSAHASLIGYAIDSSRTQLNNASDGSDPRVDENRSDSSKLSVRSDEKAYKSWIKFDVTGLDVGALPGAYLRITLHQDKDNSALLSAVNDDYTTGIGWTEDDLTWNNAPGNITSADGINPDDAGFTVDNLRADLDPTVTTFIGPVDYPGGVAGDQYFFDVLSILQADTDGIVQFVLHGAGGNTNFSTHDHPNGTDYYPALLTVPEPTTVVLLALGSLLAFRRKR
jgi:hypothetical protein